MTGPRDLLDLVIVCAIDAELTLVVSLRPPDIHNRSGGVNRVSRRLKVPTPIKPSIRLSSARFFILSETHKRVTNEADPMRNWRTIK